MSNKLIQTINNPDNSKTVKIYFNKDFDEYIVKPTPLEKTWYFTDDKQDAIQTAKVMLV